MIVKTWNNGRYYQTGAGYGIKISPRDRDAEFRGLDFVELFLEGEPDFVLIDIRKESFWRSCSELIHKKIGLWLIKNNLQHWTSGKPHSLELIKTSKNKFTLQKG